MRVEDLLGINDPDPVTAAAEALADAVRKKPSCKPISVWKKTVAKHLGVKRLHKKRLDAVLERGVEKGLFVIRDEGAKPWLEAVTGDPPQPSTPAKAPVPVVEQEQDEPPPEVKGKFKPKAAPPPELPEDWTPPEFFGCGHINWERDEEAHAEARAEGFCCNQGKRKVGVHWDRLKGKYVRPLPKTLRRSPEKVDQGGFPGYCCDKDGYYLGGTINDCSHYGNRDKCTYHGPKEEK